MFVSAATSSAHRTRLLAPFFILFATALWAGCGGSSSGDVTIEERDGVTYVTNTGTTVWEDHDAAPIQFELEQTFGAEETPEEAMLADVRGVVVDAEGAVYVLDYGNNRLVAFNPDGSLRWSAGREGEGPGEFSNAYGMAGDGDGRLYVSNQMNSRVDIWTTDGTFVESIGIDELDVRGSVTAYANGHLILSRSAYGGDPQKLYFIDTDTWTHDRTVEVDFDLDLPDGMGVGGGVSVYDEHLWVSHVTAYQLRQYTLNGTQTRQIDRPNIDTIMGPGVFQGEGSTMMRMYGYLGAPAVLPNGHMLVASSWPTNVQDPNEHTEQSANDNAEDPIPASAIDLFDPEGRFQGRLLWEEMRTPGIGRIQTTGPEGTLYTTVSTPFPQVRRYAVTVD
ncbi:hypothetical protein CRI93_12355 [Longimonas halophila]|uniref:6-bladed beta-propeller n=1 Tax=Longimonas halophila TaxID=1469170 RepID=A0A2H3P347_9BACT|nr:6-bladed beta-propeller [Longimonas halophila]PEN05693.1 hypothetical protein CRI93_12355 [Longimonas halophila]